jgi:hypothetical protein
METTIKNIGLLFMGVLLMVSWGFYHTFLKLFTGFNGSGLAQHLPQIAFVLWFALIAAQPVLTYYKKTTAKKILKTCSYILAPMVMFAICYMAKEQYLQDVSQVNENEAIARQSLALPNAFAFAALYILAMFHKANNFACTRYILAATLLLVGLGLGHAFITYIHFPFSMGISLSVIITDLVLLTLLLNDRIYGHTAKPYAVSLGVILSAQIFWFCLQNTSLWQNAAGKFVQAFF